MDAQYSRRDRITSRTAALPHTGYGFRITQAPIFNGEYSPGHGSGPDFQGV